MNLHIPNDLTDLLLEFGDSHGLTGETDEETCLNILTYVVHEDELDFEREAGGSGPLNEDISALVESITNFNAGGKVEVLSDPEDDPTPRRPSTFEDLSRLYPDDPLVMEALELGDLEQAALAELYDNLPDDMYGTPGAVRLWNRQIMFRRGIPE